MGYLDGFYTDLNARTAQQKLIAAAHFVVTVEDELFSWGYLLLEEGIDSKHDIELDLSKIRRYILGDDKLLKAVDSFLKRCDESGKDFMNLLDTDVDTFDYRVLCYLRNHKIPSDVIDAGWDITDEHWNETLDFVLDLQSENQ